MLTIASPTSGSAPATNTAPAYRLEEAVGFMLRQVMQRHNGIFSGHMREDVTAVQWAALVKLHEIGSCSQNQLGRLTSMDAPTIKGVVDRLQKRALIKRQSDAGHKRRILFSLTEEGEEFVRSRLEIGLAISRETLRPLTSKEEARFLELLAKLR